MKIVHHELRDHTGQERPCREICTVTIRSFFILSWHGQQDGEQQEDSGSVLTYQTK